MKKINRFISGLCLLALASCGGKDESSKSTQEKQHEVQTEGVFKAILRPYNFTAAGWIPNGMADIKVVGDEIEIKSWMDDSANVVHMQNIHVGSKCPSMAQDANKDGFVDFNESMNFSGKILMALDSDLNSQGTDGSIYPKGNYAYFQTGSLSAIRSAFTQTVEGRVIIVTGTANDPSMPIACGIIERMPEA
jgi:hypothetical protein